MFEGERGLIGLIGLMLNALRGYFFGKGGLRPVKLELNDRAISSYSDFELTEEVNALDAFEARIKARRLVLVAEIDKRACYRDDGATSAAAWLVGNSTVSSQSANEIVDVARKADELPAIKDAIAAGDLSWDVAKEVAKIATPENVDGLVESAATWSASQASLHVRRQREISRREGEQIERSRSLRTWWTRDKTALVLNGQLPPDGGAILEAALARIIEGCDKRDEEGNYLAPDQLRADAIVELASARLGADTDIDRATVAVHVDYETLLTGSGVGEVGDGFACPDVVHMMGCDSRIQVVLDDLDGTPVGIGRAERNVPAWLRRAVIRRDKTCVFPGCERRNRLICHHIEWWARDLGRTDEENLVALCRSHHRLPHVMGWTVTGTARSGLRFVSPSGKTFESPPRKPNARVSRAKSSLDPPDGDADRSVDCQGSRGASVPSGQLEMARS